MAQTVDSIVNRQAIEGDIKFVISNLDAVLAKIAEVNAASRSTENGGGAPGGGSGAGRGRQQMTELERLQKRYNELQNEGAKEVFNLKEKIRQQTQELRNSAKIFSSTEGSLDRLRGELIAATAAYDAMGKQQREFTEEGKQAKKTVDELTAAVLKLETGTGRHQRDVGRYTKAFEYDGVNAQLQGLLREVPSAQNLNQLFLSWSNQFPQFFDEISRAADKMKSFKEETEAAAAAQQAAAKIQEAATGAADEAADTLDDSINSTIANIQASHEQAVALKEQIAEQIAAAEAGQINTAEAVANTEALAINAGATLEDAAAIGANTAATIEANISRAQAVATLEAQTVALETATVAQAKNASVAARFFKSLFSINSLLTVGVILLTSYGAAAAEAISDLVTQTTQAEKTAEGVKQAIQDITEEATKNTADAISQVKRVGSAFDEARRGVISKKEALAIYNNTLGETLGTAKTYNEAEADYIKKTPDYLKYTLQRAIAQAAFKKAADQTIEAQFAVDKSIREAGDGFWSGIGTGLKGMLQTGNVMTGFAAGLRQAAENGQENAKSFLDQASALEKFGAEAQATADALGKSLGIDITGSKSTNNKDAEKLAELLRDIRKEWERITKAAIDYKNAQDAVFESTTPGYRPDETNADKQKKLQENLQSALSGMDQAFAVQRLDIEKRYRAGEIKNVEDYQKALEANELAHNDARLKINVQYYMRLRELKIAAGEDTSALDAAIRNEEIENIKAHNKRIESEEADAEKKRREREERERAIQEKKKEALQYSFQTIESLLDAQSQKELDRLSKEEAAVSARYEQERIKVENSLLTQEERQRQLIALNAGEEAERNRLAQEREKQEKEQAANRKRLAIFQIILNTATAVSEQLKQPGGYVVNLPLAKAIAVAGLAQLAAASAAQYAEGTDNHPGGPAIMGEEGKELVIEKSGRAWLTEDHATLYKNLSRGAKVIPHDETMRLAAMAQMYGMGSMAGLAGMDGRKLDALIDATKQQTRAVTQAIGAQKFPSFGGNNGWNYYTRDIYN